MIIVSCVMLFRWLWDFDAGVIILGVVRWWDHGFNKEVSCGCIGLGVGFETEGQNAMFLKLAVAKQVCYFSALCTVSHANA